MSQPAGPSWGGDPSRHAAPDPRRPGPLEPSVAIGMLQRGQSLAEQGEWDLAATTFSRVVGSPDPALHVAALLGLAEARYRLDDEPGALQAWITATQAPETPLAWRAWKQLAAARVRAGDLRGAARAYREAERRAPPAERSEIAARLGWLSKETGDAGAASRAFGRARGGSPSPVVTWALLAITVGIGISQFLLGQDRLWTSLLALEDAGVAAGEYWRLLTPVLVHGTLLHLALNMYALWIIGPVVETLYGSPRFLFIYLACAAAGSTASFVFSGAPGSVGASGAIFGLFGVLLVADRVHKPALTRGARSLTMQIGMLIAVNLVIGFTVPRIDNAAHIGGLLAGAWLGLVMVPRGATLGSFWNRPSASPGAASGGVEVAVDRPSGGPALDLTRLMRLLGVLLLFSVIALGVAIGPLHLAG